MAVPFIGSLASTLPRQLRTDSFESFMATVRSKGNDNATSAGLHIQNLIIHTLQKKVKLPNATREVKETLAKRLKYFKSPMFVKNFISTVPVRDRWGQSVKSTSYSDWLDTLFNVSYGSWRDEDLIKPSNQQQCIGALGELGRDVSLLQDTEPLRVCYLCGQEIIAGEPTMECEHVLPIITALSHLWLAQERIATYTPEERKMLRLEYAWSHKCCNRIKSNYDFIIRHGNRYVVNNTLIDDFSAAVNAPPEKIGCEQIVDVPKFRLNALRPLKKNKLLPRITEIVQVINKNIAQFNDIDLYLLWTKYKILFALTDKSFLDAIVGDGTLATATPVYRDPVKIAEKRAREAEVAAEEAAFWEFKKEGPARRAAKRAAAEAALVQGGGGSNRLVSSNIDLDPIQPNDFLVTYDEDVTFPREFLHIIGDIANLPQMILNMPLPNLDFDLDMAMGPKPPESYIRFTIRTTDSFEYKKHKHISRYTKKTNSPHKKRFTSQRFTQKVAKPKHRYIQVLKP
jgi:hypothetical protein